MWHLSQKRSTNLTLIYSHLTAGKVINLSLNCFRRGNYNMEMQHPEMNNSCHDKKVHQLLRTFIVRLCSVLFAVKCGHGGRDECEIKAGFLESGMQQNFTSCVRPYSSCSTAAKQHPSHLTRCWCRCSLSCGPLEILIRTGPHR